MLTEAEITVGRHLRIYNISLKQIRHTDRVVLLTVGIITRVTITREAITTHSNNHTKHSLSTRDNTEATAVGDTKEVVAV